MKKLLSFALVAIMVLCILPISVYATADEHFDPKGTNEYYEGLIKGAHSDAFDEAIEGLNYDDSMLWVMTGATRALLVSSLAVDLEEHNRELAKKYVENASEYYIGIMPPLFGENKYTYAVCFVDGKNCLMLTYTPGFDSCGYIETGDFSQKNIDNLSLMTVKIWTVSIEDFMDMMEIINSAESSFSQTEEDNTSKEWLNNLSGEVENHDLGESRLEQFTRYCGSWTLYSGDMSIIPYIVGRSGYCYEFQTYVTTEEDNTVLHLSAQDGKEEYRVDFIYDSDRDCFCNNDYEPYSYQIAINEKERMSVLMYNANTDSLLTSSEYRNNSTNYATSNAQGTETAAPEHKPSPTPGLVLSRSEIEDKAGMALTITLMLEYRNYSIGNSGFRVDSVIESSDGWDVKGTVYLYDNSNNLSTHTFSVHIDEKGNAGLCRIS